MMNKLINTTIAATAAILTFSSVASALDASVNGSLCPIGWTDVLPKGAQFEPLPFDDGGLWMHPDGSIFGWAEVEDDECVLTRVLTAK